MYVVKSATVISGRANVQVRLVDEKLQYQKFRKVYKSNIVQWDGWAILKSDGGATKMLQNLVVLHRMLQNLFPEGKSVHDGGVRGLLWYFRRGNWTHQSEHFYFWFLCLFLSKQARPHEESPTSSCKFLHSRLQQEGDGRQVLRVCIIKKKCWCVDILDSKCQ